MRLMIDLTPEEEAAIGGWVNFGLANPEFADYPTKIVLSERSRARFDEVAAQFAGQLPAGVTPIGSAGRADIWDWDGSRRRQPLAPGLLYCVRFVVAAPPYKTAFPLIRGSVAIVPAGSGQCFCRIAEQPYEIGQLMGYSGPWSAGGGTDYQDWPLEGSVGKTLYMTYGLGPSQQATDVNVLVQIPEPL